MVSIKVPVQKEREFKKVPPGAHFARCVQVVDLGVQASEWKGQRKQTRKVYLKFEIPDEVIEWTDRDGVEHTGPMTIGATYTLSLGDKANLRRDLENWKGKSFTDEEIANFDIGTILGRCAQVMVTHETGANGKVYANLTGIMGLSKDQRGRADQYKGTEGCLIYSPSEHDQEVFDKLPSWLQEKVGQRVANDYEGLDAKTSDSDPDDDIPF